MSIFLLFLFGGGGGDNYAQRNFAHKIVVVIDNFVLSQSSEGHSGDQ